ncbi:hypothetical protein BJ508DRAFT_332902 [Ascobolus immersus RN42]|uniref:Uncharacterized protein n=1 Tax=Ascobolus immersus RN42 TaxID=1160509 RepID=A0A3N4HLC0_ASCIM|nr:hypothetical protein BJ508DRAFT_332902 [Ascobolus immersus RN42]
MSSRTLPSTAPEPSQTTAAAPSTTKTSQTAGSAGSGLPVLMLEDDARITTDAGGGRWIDGMDLDAACRTRLPVETRLEVMRIISGAQSMLDGLINRTGQSRECIMMLADFYKVDLIGSDLATGKRRRHCSWNVFQSEIAYKEDLVDKPETQAEFENAAQARAVAYAEYIKDPKNLADLQKRAKELNDTSQFTTDQILDRERKRFYHDAFNRAKEVEPLRIESLIFISDPRKPNGIHVTGSALGCAYDEHTLNALKMGSEAFHTFVQGREFHKRVALYKSIQGEQIEREARNLGKPCHPPVQSPHPHSTQSAPKSNAVGFTVAQAKEARLKRARIEKGIPEPPKKKLTKKQAHRAAVHRAIHNLPEPAKPVKATVEKPAVRAQKDTKLNQVRAFVIEAFCKAVRISYDSSRRLPKETSCRDRLAAVGKRWSLPDGLELADYYSRIRKDVDVLDRFLAGISDGSFAIVEMSEAEKEAYSGSTPATATPATATPATATPATATPSNSSATSSAKKTKGVKFSVTIPRRAPRLTRSKARANEENGASDESEEEAIHVRPPKANVSAQDTDEEYDLDAEEAGLNGQECDGTPEAEDDEEDEDTDDEVEKALVTDFDEEECAEDDDEEEVEMEEEAGDEEDDSYNGDFE